MKWIKGLLVLGMVMFTHSTILINDVEARSEKTQQSTKKTSKKAKASKKEKGRKGSKTRKHTSTAAPKKTGFLSSIKGAFSSVGSKISAGAKSLGSKVSNSVNCRAGKGEAPGAALYDMAKAGEKLTDAHVVTAHASPNKATAQASGRKKGRS